MIRTLCIGPLLLLLLLAPCVSAAERSQPASLQRAVPPDVYLAVHYRHNPERDYQGAYYQAIYDTVRDTKIMERVIKIVTSRAPEEELEKVTSVLQQLAEAVEPIDVEAIFNCEEAIYAQLMQAPTSQHLFLLRMTPEAAAAGEAAVKNLFELLAGYSDGDVTVETTQQDDVTRTSLVLPGPVPFRPTVACIDDVLLVSTSEETAQRSLGMLVGGEGPSKFDDPRLKNALRHLPEPEDSLVFYDGALQFKQMREIGSFIRQVASDDPKAEQMAELIDLVIDEVAILDFEITVEYTEDNHNRSAAYGKLVPGAEDKLLFKVFGSGQAFEDWQRWIPEGAVSYSLSTGANLHPLYERLIEIAKEQFPDAEMVLQKFEAIQEEIGVHLDRDILQAFSGESVSVSLPAAVPSLFRAQDSVFALRCQKPDRIRELLHELVERLQLNPVVKAQNVSLSESEGLEGFEQLSALSLAPLGIRPVIGFHDGWMIVGSDPSAVKKILQTKAGEGRTVVDSESFQRFNLEIEGPVNAIGYSNLAESTRGVARLLSQAGMFAPMILGLAGADADPELLKPVQEALALLPSVAKIVAKFDFLEEKISVTQDGDEPGTYVRHTVIVVRPESEDEGGSQEGVDVQQSEDSPSDAPS